MLRKKTRVEWFAEQYGEVNALMKELEESREFPFQYFCGHSIRKKEKANVESGADLCRSWALSVSSKIRGHIIPFFGWNEDENIRYHFHTQVFSDVEIEERVLKDTWYRFGIGKFEKYNPNEHGDKYIFKKHFFENGFYPFCGVNRSPCRKGRVQQCIHRNRRLEIQMSRLIDS